LFIERLQFPVVRGRDAPVQRKGIAVLARTPPAVLDIRTLPLDVVCGMFDRLGNVAFYVKSAELRYICGNETMYALCGVDNADEFVGKGAEDFFSPLSRRGDDAADALVLRTGKASAESMILTLRLRGEPVWLARRRWPWLDESQNCVGVIGLATTLDPPEKQRQAHVRLAMAIEHIGTCFREPYDVTGLAVTGLARKTGISVAQLERDFTSLMGLTPRAYIAKVRLETAMELLRGGEAIVEIAQACGYSDQSAFTRRFRRATGMSPSQYRRSKAA